MCSIISIKMPIEHPHDKSFHTEVKASHIQILSLVTDAMQLNKESAILYQLKVNELRV